MCFASTGQHVVFWHLEAIRDGVNFLQKYWFSFSFHYENRVVFMDEPDAIQQRFGVRKSFE